MKITTSVFLIVIISILLLSFVVVNIPSVKYSLRDNIGVRPNLNAEGIVFVKTHSSGQLIVIPIKDFTGMPIQTGNEF